MDDENLTASAVKEDNGKECPQFTTDSWLDGLIFGSAYGSIKDGFSLFLGTLPISKVELIAQSFQSAGYSVRYSSNLDNVSVEDDHVLDIQEERSKFKTLQLPPLRNVGCSYPSEFLDGYILSRMYPVFILTGNTPRKKDIASRIRLRIRTEIGNADVLLAVLKQRNTDAKMIHEGCIEISESSHSMDSIDDYLGALVDELEADSDKNKTAKMKDWQERSYSKINIDLPGGRLIQDMLSPYVIAHLSKKAGINNKLSSRERGAIRGISSLIINRRKPSDKQQQYLEGLIKKSIILGLVNDPCDRESCWMCSELKKFTNQFHIDKQLLDQ